jgi:hypothetical protein
MLRLNTLPQKKKKKPVERKKINENRLKKSSSSSIESHFDCDVKVLKPHSFFVNWNAIPFKHWLPSRS